MGETRAGRVTKRPLQHGEASDDFQTPPKRPRIRNTPPQKALAREELARAMEELRADKAAAAAAKKGAAAAAAQARHMETELRLRAKEEKRVAR
jgi:hypothetical protein